ncbi:hypothetical protein PS726_01629 [Pseudomonas fluorescens]|uniref:Uncharacterized protein n=1 Tax=Pseudomonas fluorescens TaxID=294 RepID=A0A8H2RG55_PSEFL|nr:hypothetical protein [Pseudomonas fluorescens]CAG8866429.1 hypothetical protein PS861_01446 [Pseudomonas fluorescens]VVN87918.1 hypothetical protein PS726_01629 [Pseudomonas fluorescens]VVO59737.1 hypothetical protein PS900_00734 [Pseudomonas fluorescens]VVP75101.1 hypothetical protein PS934_00148 [Pseudomonas fluorescens]
MEDIFVVKRCNKIIIHGRREGEVDHLPPDAAVWYRIADTRTQGFIGDGYEVEEDALRVCRQLNAKSQVTARQS